MKPVDPAPSLPPNYEEAAYRVFLDSLDYLPPADVDRIKSAYAFAAHDYRHLQHLTQKTPSWPIALPLNRHRTPADAQL